MLGIAHIVSLGLVGSLIALVFWAFRRSASASDGQLAAVKDAGELSRQLEARGQAVATRDQTIAALQAENARLHAAVEAASTLQPIPEAPADASVSLRSSLDRLRNLARMSAVVVPAAPEPGPAPHR